ncbi:MAG TPA: murein L,D-transpeptidase catalytic domain family protein [Longimicrobiaceae bacterium]|nr:murein L,D-transpeptidase catalytic domain family protein [Longimicrobiaceae bacterium]
MRRLLVLAAASSVVGICGALPRNATQPGIPSYTPTVTAPATVPTARASLVGVKAPAPAAEKASGPAALVQSALDALTPLVPKTSSPLALRYAFEAYYHYRAAHPEKVRNPYLYFVDYGLDNRTPRGYVFDMVQQKIVDGPFNVAHGRGSSSGSNGVPTRFSNRDGSAASSLGLFLTQESYDFTGHSGGSTYHSIGLRLQGLSGRFNDAARARHVVVHGAPYVTPGRAGRSEGCPAMSRSRAERLIPEIDNGGLVFLFSPNDTTWLDADPWVHRSLAQAEGAAG